MNRQRVRIALGPVFFLFLFFRSLEIPADYFGNFYCKDHIPTYSLARTILFYISGLFALLFWHIRTLV